MELQNKHKTAIVVSAVAIVVILAALLVVLQGRRNVINGDYPYTPPTGTAPVTTTQPPETPAHGQEETVPPSVWNTVPDLGASYEQWLSAAMFLLLPREYPDFQLQGIYTASNTEISQSSQSLGAYIVFTSGGREIWIHSLPLTQPRTEAGVTDLYTAQLGHATFDRVEPGSVDLSALEQQNLEDLALLVDFSMLVTLHSR